MASPLPVILKRLETAALGAIRRRDLFAMTMLGAHHNRMLGRRMVENGNLEDGYDTIEQARIQSLVAIHHSNHWSEDRKTRKAVRRANADVAFADATTPNYHGITD